VLLLRGELQLEKCSLLGVIPSGLGHLIGARARINFKQERFIFFQRGPQTH
jgi:hypothetical protein